MVILLLLWALVMTMSEAGIHEDSAGWCAHGSTTATTEECVCSVHKGFHCVGSECQDGFGMSFFAKSCTDCKCDLNHEWKERKKAMRDMLRQDHKESSESDGARGSWKRKPTNNDNPQREARRI